ncbi:MAG TPA: TonB-dependent receptor [Rhizomicrobium sp.]|nr:TonB-dependent receptor [Rhizomicrobium sp.]
MVRGVKTQGVHGDLQPDAALAHILQGTGFVTRRYPSGAIGIDRETSSVITKSVELAEAPAASATGAALETVTVTSSKIGGDVQNIPISITALSQEQLTATQTAGGPDLVKQVPNMTFTKTNFTGYSIQLRGIGTQAISVTTDPAVAVAFNDVPFIRNHFFEQEFYDVSQVEVLRGPQGTLYGRNATAGVVNLVSAKPSDQFEAMASIDVGNYGERRTEGMINLPIVDDKLDIRVAGEWTKRQGYSFNQITDSRIDGRDLWSGRVTIGWKPMESLQAYFVWEHFSEDDDRLRSSKQLCEADYRSGTGPTDVFSGPGNLSQGCLPVSLYSPQAFETPNGDSLPYVIALKNIGPRMEESVNPYLSTTQSTNLRVIESTLNPAYKVKNDIVELNADYSITPVLMLTSQTAFNHDFLYSSEDYNRFNTSPNIFVRLGSNFLDSIVVPNAQSVTYPDGAVSGVFCDPQLGCTSRLVAEDLSDEHAWQLSQEFRMTSNFSGPVNFSAGGNYFHYETLEDYYVFINALSLYSTEDIFTYDTPSDISSNTGTHPYIPGISDNSNCAPFGFSYPDLSKPQQATGVCPYMDPNPIPNINGMGHNYFRSVNPYVLNSYAAFGEMNYSVLDDLKLTAGLRWTEDQKHFTDIPSELLAAGWGYPASGVVNQQWDQFSGRFVANWTPKLDFTDQTLVYGSYSHGYKAGGANPPGALILNYGGDAVGTATHPLTFKPEFVDAFELGAKNTLLDGSLTLNGDVFYYNYENYQISEIVDRTSINLNFDSHIMGAELESTWEPTPGLRFNFGGGWEHTRLAQGSQAIDLMDRTAGVPGWVVHKPFVTGTSNCILPISDENNGCGFPTAREGFAKNLSGNQLPNAPPFTVSMGAQYTLPLSPDWAGTLRGDYYWQDYSWGRVFNDNPYDRLRGYTNVNLTLIFTNQNGWQVMLYDKNVFNVTAITGTFLNSDDSGLTTNVFLTDPKLIGIRVTKNW